MKYSNTVKYCIYASHDVFPGSALDPLSGPILTGIKHLMMNDRMNKHILFVNFS